MRGCRAAPDPPGASGGQHGPLDAEHPLQVVCLNVDGECEPECAGVRMCAHVSTPERARHAFLVGPTPTAPTPRGEGRGARTQAGDLLWEVVALGWGPVRPM